MLDNFEIDEDSDAYKRCCEVVRKMIPEEDAQEYCLSSDQVKLFLPKLVQTSRN